MQVIFHSYTNSQSARTGFILNSKHSMELHHRQGTLFSETGVKLAVAYSVEPAAGATSLVPMNFIGPPKVM